MELQGFDTLEATRILESVGMETEHAEAVVQVVKAGADNLAVRSDIADLKQDVSVLKTDSATLKTDVVLLKSEVGRINENMATKADIKDMATKADVERQFNKTLVAGITIAGALFTALKLFG